MYNEFVFILRQEILEICRFTDTPTEPHEL